MTERGQSKPPEALAEFIELVNAEQMFDRELPDMQAGYYSAAEAYRRDQSVSMADIWSKACEDAAAVLSPITRAFLGPPANLQVFLDRFSLLKSAGQVLVGIARQNRLTYRPQSSCDVLIHDAQFGAIPCHVIVNLVVNEHGLLTVSQSPLLEAFAGVRADRIRSCRVCERIFWATRVNSECCNERCRKAFNQRNSREVRRRLLTKKKPRLKEHLGSATTRKGPVQPR